MQPNDLNERLSSIKTYWSMLFQAHRGEGNTSIAAQQQLLLRYYGAVYHYLLGIVRDPAAAEELTQDFAVRFLRGDFRGANAERGRFRDFVRTAVRHLAHDYWRKREKEKGIAGLPDDGIERVDERQRDVDKFDQEFLEKWREELLARSWDALAEFQEQSGQPYFQVLLAKVNNGEKSAQIADRLSAERGKPFTELGVRQLVHRARKKFAELLVDEVARSLQTSEPEELEQELIELNLLDYCRSTLQNRKQQG
jgi:RNA polymerase sigma-70 factor (ECF subfamily)